MTRLFSMAGAFALLAVAAGCGGGGGSTPPSEVAGVVDLDGDLSVDFSLLDEGALWSVESHPDGLHISKPGDPGALDPGNREAGYIEGGVTSRFVVEGDFSVSVDFRLHDFTQPTESRLTESILGVVTPDDVFRFWVLRFQHLMTGSRIEVWHEPLRQYSGQQNNTMLEGRYRIRRIGDVMIGEFAATGTEEWQELGTLPGVPTGPMHIQLLGRQGADYAAVRSSMHISFDRLIVESEGRSIP